MISVNIKIINANGYILRPGDKVILSFRQSDILNDEELVEVANKIRRTLGPYVKVLFVDDNIELNVIRNSDVDMVA